MKGVPIRLEIGPKDIQKQQVVLVRRDTGEKPLSAKPNCFPFTKHAKRYSRKYVYSS